MTELIPYQDRTLTTYDEIERAAKAMAGSGFFTDTRMASQAIVKIMAGRELGVGPFASMTGVNIIQGKPAFGANIMAACVKKSGRYNYRVTEMTDKACTIEFMEKMDGKWLTSGVSSFTLEDAKKAGTKNLEKFPRNMLFARAMSNGVRWFCPDVMNGSVAYTPEELGADVDQDGNVVEVVDVIKGEPTREPAPIEIAAGGWDDPLWKAEATPKPDPAPTMTVEEAYATTNSKGVQYGSMTEAVLEKILSSLYKTLNAGELSDEDKAEIEKKIRAAKIVYDAKKDGSIR